MANIYEVEITYVTLVEAESEEDAHWNASSEIREITNDSEPEIHVDRKIKSLDKLPHPWDGKCLPYGGDGAQRLNEILPATEAEAAPEKDTKTIDMFEGA